MILGQRGSAPTPWSAATWRGFGPRRPVADTLAIFQLTMIKTTLGQSADRSAHSKELALLDHAPSALAACLRSISLTLR
jgi:hypothetical protein